MKSKAMLKAALAAMLVATVISSGLAMGAHPFNDVGGGRFYSDAVDWAYNNGVTTGTSASTFSPDAKVSRAENITFTWRYDDLIVQPALAARATQAQVDATVAAATPRVHTKSRTGWVTTTTGAYTTVPGMAFDYVVPAGQTQMALITFSAENQCAQDPVVTAWCNVQFLVDGVVIINSIFNSVEHGANKAGAADYAFHSMQWSTGPLGPGVYPIEVQYAIDEINGVFTIGDRTLTVMGLPASHITVE